jgi:hypothetical protein
VDSKPSSSAKAVVLIYLLGQIAWKRLSDLAMSITYTGLHHDGEAPKDALSPSFITEIKRRLFACAFRLDKSISTLLGRPPRLHHAYCTVEPPADLPNALWDEQTLMQSPHGSDLLSWRVDWPTPVSFVRMGLFVSRDRESILEICLAPQSTHTQVELR